MKRISIVLTSLALAAALSACGSQPEICHPFGGTCPKGGHLISCCTPDNTMCDVIASDNTDFPCQRGDCGAASMLAATWCQGH